jgi:hypothetical protein
MSDNDRPLFVTLGGIFALLLILHILVLASGCASKPNPVKAATPQVPAEWPKINQGQTWGSTPVTNTPICDGFQGSRE